MAVKVSGLAGACVNELMDMRSITKQNYAFDARRPTGTLDFLLSPGNGRVVMDNTQQGRKYLETTVHYKLRTTPCSILTGTQATLCDTPQEPAELSKTVAITLSVSTTPKAFSNSNMINICQDTQSFVREYMVSDMNALKEKVNDMLLAKLDAGSGRNHRYNGTNVAEITNTTLQLLGTSSEQGAITPLFGNFADIGLDYRHNQMNGIPNLIGEGILSKFWLLQQFSCCNSDGVAYDNAIAQSGHAFWLDHGANSVLGSNEFLVVAPNVAHVLWFNKNQNININTEIQVHSVVPDPDYPQLKWNFDFYFDKCTKQWIYTLSADFDLFTPPTDQFGSDDLSSPVCADAMVGTTGIFKYKAS